MEPEGSLPRSQQPASENYAEPNESSQFQFSPVHFNIILLWFLPFKLLNQNIVRICRTSHVWYMHRSSQPP
jgi:hypothetical protein